MIRVCLAIVLLLAVTACDPPAGTDPAAPPQAASSDEPPQLPAADPTEPPLEAFRVAAVDACAAAQAWIAKAPLRGDPLAATARRRDVTAAVKHFRTAARAWSVAGNDLFTFGLPQDPIGQSFIGALDTLALRMQQAGDALATGDAAQAQGAVAFADEARRVTDRIARDLGIGPLEQCGEDRAPRTRRRVRVTAIDFGFRLTPPERGRTRIILRNAGEEEHHLFVVRLREPGTLDDAVRADRHGGDPGAFLAGDGTTSAVIAPGERTTMTVNLRPGPYGLACFVASPDGTPHAFKGMAAEIFID